MSHWLSLKISDPIHSQSGGKAGIFISVPKKIVRLATDRNRIKRLIREVLRSSDAPKIFPGKVYYFRVLSKPLNPVLEDAKKEFRKLSWQ